MALVRMARATPDRVDFSFRAGFTTVAGKRNGAVNFLLEEPCRRWILHLDSDMDPPVDVIQRLWRTAERAGADVVQPAMVLKDPPHDPGGTVVAERGEPVDPLRPVTSDPDIRLRAPTPESLARRDAPVDVDCAGTGCLLVRREVHEALEDPQFAARGDGGGSDYNFTLRATDAGFRCVLDPSVRVGHVACHAYGLDDAVRSREKQERIRRQAVGLRA